MTTLDPATLTAAADEITRTARAHVAAGRGHMTWAEAVTILRRLAAIPTQET